MANQGASRTAPARAPGSSPAAGEAVGHRRLQANGIGMHVAEAGSGPLVVLLHGLPELWCSWRQQLPVLAAAGYHAVAPDLGATATPTPQRRTRATCLEHGRRHRQRVPSFRIVESWDFGPQPAAKSTRRDHHTDDRCGAGLATSGTGQAA